MKLTILLILSLFALNSKLDAQTKQDTLLYKELWTANKKGMFTLTSWGAANIASGLVFAPRTSGEAHYFHQMNGLWNTVNFGLGVFGLIKSQRMLKRPQYDQFPTSILKAEKSYRINFYVDFGYIAAGTGLLLFNDRFSEPARAKGFGTSVITQGVFLLGFDWFMSRYIRKKLK